MLPEERDGGIVVSGGGDTDQEVVGEVLKVDTCLYSGAQLGHYGGIVVAVSVDGRRFGSVCGLWDGGLFGGIIFYKGELLVSILGRCWRWGGGNGSSGGLFGVFIPVRRWAPCLLRFRRVARFGRLGVHLVHCGVPVLLVRGVAVLFGLIGRPVIAGALLRHPGRRGCIIEDFGLVQVTKYTGPQRGSSSSGVSRRFTIIPIAYGRASSTTARTRMKCLPISRNPLLEKRRDAETPSLA